MRSSVCASIISTTIKVSRSADARRRQYSNRNIKMETPTEDVKPIETTALLAIGEQLRTQDNRCTANPAFCVQVLERIGPIMLEYGSGEICFHDPEQCETYYKDGPDPERWKELRRVFRQGDLPGEITISSYVEKWITVQTCFTEQGCKRYLELDGHNLRHFHGVRIYAESFGGRNLEMLEIRKALLALANK